MSEILIPLPRADEAYLRQVMYSLHFCDPAITSFALRDGVAAVTLADGAPPDGTGERVARLLERYAGLSEEFAPREVFSVSPSNAGVKPDPHDEMVRRGWVVPVALGQVVLRGLALELLEFIDATVLRLIAEPMGARPEYYPSGISCEALAKTAHFASFPEHIQFVCHLTPDINVIDAFTSSYRNDPDLASASGDGRAFALPAVVMNPSVCYHCYNALQQTSVPGPGLAVTARSRCQRYEGGNHDGLRRLMDFTMREVIFIGRPEYVLETRAKTVRTVERMMRYWELECRMESSNDPFFTDDYATKAAFQRQQDLKYELRAALPFDPPASLAIASSNYHSVTFGKAFHIKVGSRPACTGCLGFGLERLMYSVFAQHGLDPAGWPEGLREDLRVWRCWERPE